MMKSSIPILILAAGSSSRMGQSKQMLLIKDEPLLRRTVRTALSTNGGNIIVVLGSVYEEHLPMISDMPVDIVHNEQWDKGIGSSLKAGLRYIVNSELAEALMILVCDQAFVTGEYLDKLINAYRKHTQSSTTIVASKYGNTVGVPAIFDKVHFDELLALEDDKGAKKVIMSHSEGLYTVDFPEGILDIDTPEDYEELKKKLKH